MTVVENEFDDELDSLTNEELKEKVRELMQLVQEKGVLDMHIVPASQLVQAQLENEIQVVLQEPDVQMIKFFLDVRKSMDKKQKVVLKADRTTGIAHGWELR